MVVADTSCLFAGESLEATYFVLLPFVYRLCFVTFIMPLPGSSRWYDCISTRDRMGLMAGVCLFVCFGFFFLPTLQDYRRHDCCAGGESLFAQLSSLHYWNHSLATCHIRATSALDHIR